MKNQDMLPMFIRRCLTYGVKIFPYQLETILTNAEQFSIPDDRMSTFSREEIEKYVEALYLASQEYARDWSKGLDLLKELGFEEETRVEGHRTFISLKYTEHAETRN